MNKLKELRVDRIRFFKSEISILKNWDEKDGPLLKTSFPRPDIVNNIERDDFIDYLYELLDIFKFAGANEKNLFMSEYKVSKLNQIKSHLDSRLESFEYSNYKGLILCKSIEEQEILCKLVDKAGFHSLAINSLNIRDYNNLTNSQMTSVEELLKEGLIIEPYNFIIINKNLVKNIDINDDGIKLVITSEISDVENVTNIYRKDMDTIIIP